MTTSKLSEIISPAFYEPHRAIREGRVDEVVAKGGRGSTKSSWASLEILTGLIRHPDCHAVVIRKVKDTLRLSVYPQMCWAVSALGLNAKCRCTVSPMEITYTPTGQKVYFIGLDDPSKSKSMKVPFGYIGFVWFEELDQYSGPDEIRTVEQSLLRGGPYSLTLKTFNPPQARRNWANEYALEQKPGKMVHHSTFLTTPAEWLGPRFLADAEHLKATKPTAYAHEYEGKVTGTGTEVFDNVVGQTITNEQIANFDRRLYGVDWGWYPDPWAFNEGYYHPASRTLYIFGEATRWKTSNAQTAQILLDRGLTWDFPVMCDSAEPKSIQDYKASGIHAKAVSKPPGSVEYATGMTKAWVRHELNSYKGWRGVAKKVGYLVLVAVAAGIDWLVQSGLVGIGVQLPFEYFIGILVVIWLIINEMISILENLGEIGTPEFPGLSRLLKHLKNTVEEKAGGEDDNGSEG